MVLVGIGQDYFLVESNYTCVWLYERT